MEGTICNHYKNGICVYGKQCHKRHEGKPSKLKKCKFGMMCRNGVACNFKHTSEEMHKFKRESRGEKKAENTRMQLFRSRRKHKTDNCHNCLREFKPRDLDDCLRCKRLFCWICWPEKSPSPANFHPPWWKCADCGGCHPRLIESFKKIGQSAIAGSTEDYRMYSDALDEYERICNELEKDV